MNIRGFYKTSLIDYPGKISSVVFTGGCNFKCGFCHNSDFVQCNTRPAGIDPEEILKHLKKRQGIIDGIVITGGEPAIHQDLTVLLDNIRKTAPGVSIKLDTNGSKPDILKKILNENLIDYAALDIKSSPDKYPVIAGVAIETGKIAESVYLLKESGINYEIRTTCVPDFMSEADALAIGEWIGPVKAYYLQQLVTQIKLLDPDYENKTPYDKEHLLLIKDIISRFSSHTAIRGL